MALGFNEAIYGGGVEIEGVHLGPAILGIKGSYSAINHRLGFEKDAAVEYDEDLAKELAGEIVTIWRHQFRVTATVSF